MHVIAHRLQVAGAAGFHEEGFVASTEHMAEELAPVIQAQGVGAEESTHPLHQVAIGRFDHQMKVIAHQAKSMDLKPVFWQASARVLRKS